MVDQQMAYNAIFDRPLMRVKQMITVVYCCLMIKFPTPIGVGFIRVELKKENEC